MGFFRRRRSEPRPIVKTPVRTPSEPPETDTETAVSRLSSEDRKARLAEYRQQQGSDDSYPIAAEGHTDRGPRTKAEQEAHARHVGYIARTEFMDAETEARALGTGPDGLPAARLEQERDRLLVVTSLGWVNPRSRTSWRYGLHSFALRGVSYHEAAVKAGRFTPGSPVRLVREPDNPHDSNAVAVYAENGRKVAGYVPKGQAKRIAALLDAGTDLVAISVRGSGAGSESVAPHVLACPRPLYEHLTR